MEKRILIDQEYLYVPVNTHGEERYFDIVIEDDGEKFLFTEVRIPYVEDTKETYSYDFMAEIPLKAYIGKNVIVSGEAVSPFFQKIYIGSKREPYMVKKPSVHFASDTGWINDPNGLVYKDGIYHLYYQYNPFHIVWNNMTWGHAVSTDLLHWKIRDCVMFPDENGTMFSGSGFVNKRECLGLNKDDLIFAYTVAGGVDKRSEGKPFIQKFAYSKDGGETLIKLEKPYVGKIYLDSRDPKVFWHEESHAYIMVLWLRGNNFGILRSEDLNEFTLVEEITLEDGWECPDLFPLFDENGNSKWFFWCAAGYYYVGDFDGYHFTMIQDKRKAYVTNLPYAAQTYSNTGSKTISVPWYRTANDGRPFTGTYGIPVEFSYKERDGHYQLIQKPVSQFYDQMILSEDAFESDGRYASYKLHKDACDVFMIQLKEAADDFYFMIGTEQFRYSSASGIIWQDKNKEQAGFDHRQMMILIDDKIVEIFFDQGIRTGAFWISDNFDMIKLDSLHIENISHYHVQ